MRRSALSTASWMSSRVLGGHRDCSRLTRRGVDIVRHMLPSPEGLGYAAPHWGRCSNCGSACGEIRAYALRYTDPVLSRLFRVHDGVVLCQSCAALEALAGRLWVREEPADPAGEQQPSAPIAAAFTAEDLIEARELLRQGRLGYPDSRDPGRRATGPEPGS